MPHEIDWFAILMVLVYMCVGAASVPVKYVWDDITESPFVITKRHVRGYLYVGAWLGFVTATSATDLYAFSNLGMCAIIGLSAGPVLSLMVSAGTAMAGRILKLPGITIYNAKAKSQDYDTTLDDLVNNKPSSKDTK